MLLFHRVPALAVLGLALLLGAPVLSAQQAPQPEPSPGATGPGVHGHRSDMAASRAGSGKELLQELSPRRAACLKEGSSCAAKESVCCAGLLCVGFKQPVCMPNT